MTSPAPPPSTAAATETEDDADFFLAHGYVVVKEAFSKTQADAFTRDLWVRLGLDPHDPSTWDRERIHMPSHTRVPVAQFAPKVSRPLQFRFRLRLRFRGERDGQMDGQSFVLGDGQRSVLRPWFPVVV